MERLKSYFVKVSQIKIIFFKNCFETDCFIKIKNMFTLNSTYKLKKKTMLHIINVFKLQCLFYSVL